MNICILHSITHKVKGSVLPSRKHGQTETRVYPRSDMKFILSTFVGGGQNTTMQNGFFHTDVFTVFTVKVTPVTFSPFI